MVASNPAVNPQPGPFLGGQNGRGFAPSSAYNSLVSTTQPLVIPPTRVEESTPVTLPWSRATIIGWVALAGGTILTIAIVIAAVTLP